MEEKLKKRIAIITTIGVVIGGIALFLNYFQNRGGAVSVNGNGNAAAVGDHAQATVTTITTYPQPGLAYKMVTPTKKRNDGSYEATFDVAICYGVGAQRPTATPQWASSTIFCSLAPPMQSAGYAQQTCPNYADTYEWIPYEYNCTSNEPIMDNGKLFTL